ncbi:MAG: monovalent cation/H+ antiporter complex subunit F [Lachnospiraceae bacterium]|nr:monovalent cation/H+ antiporter complex subunit F [Lachnospiraceae bacterium]
MYYADETLSMAYQLVLTAFPIILALMALLCLIRAVKGPKTADRIVAINMMGTITMVIIAILAVKMNEGYLVDVCIIYAMISFLAVTLLAKVYMGIYMEHTIRRGDGQTDVSPDEGEGEQINDGSAMD